MKLLLIINSEQIANSLKRYCEYIYTFKSFHILTEDYMDLASKDFYDYDIFVIDIYGSKNNSQCALGLHIGRILDNQQKNVVYFYTHNGLKNSNVIKHLLTNCFYLPEQLDDFLYTLNSLPQKLPAEKLIELFQSSSITSGHH
jgi:hypothetical protein